MRFAHGQNDDRTRADVERAIDMMAHVDDLSLAKCARDYHERSDAEMQVCAACGVRDPFDLCAKTVALLDLPDTHWMCADGDALERLRALPDLQLVRLEDDGSYVTERVPRVVALRG